MQNADGCARLSVQQLVLSYCCCCTACCCEAACAVSALYISPSHHCIICSSPNETRFQLLLLLLLLSLLLHNYTHCRPTCCPLMRTSAYTHLSPPPFCVELSFHHVHDNCAGWSLPSKIRPFSHPSLQFNVCHNFHWIGGGVHAQIPNHMILIIGGKNCFLLTKDVIVRLYSVHTYC